MESRKNLRDPRVSRPSLFVVIPTKDRRQSLLRALRSVALQSFSPTATLVVGDSEKDIEGLGTSLAGFSTEQGEPIPLITMVNRWTSNLSGSINTALSHILDHMPGHPTSTYIAFLDDDDYWEAGYIQKCMEAARGQDLDLVVAGIVRHEKERRGVRLGIPKNLDLREFLTTNPHIQGSNLFVRLATLLKAGCFDENLQSTTDRDVAIRLLSLGNTRVGFVQEHLVHHMAGGLNRLSSPRSESKRNGLVAFYQKYGPMMSELERARFVERASGLFGCTVQDFAGAFGG
jgi:glycosyltransferase involved in cell wall biosynthesis